MADIKEVIDMMVADGRPESEIIALIDRYNKDNEVGKTTDPASSDMDSGSGSGLLELPKIVEGKGMFAGETEVSSGFGGLVKKVKNTKDFVKDIFNTQDSVKENDEKVTSRAAEKYFSLDAMPLRELKPYDGESDFREFANTEEEDLRAYFKDAKYEEYIKWDGGNGELPASIKFKGDVEVEQKNRKRELTEEYIGINVPEDKQIEAYLALPSVVGDEKEVVIDGKTYKNPKELYNTLKKRDAELGTTKAIDFEADYLATANEAFNNDYEKYETDLAKYEKDNETILKQQTSLVDKFKKIGKVDENSSEQEISEYNALVVENNNLQDQLDQSGSNALIETQKSLKTRFDDLISKADTFENTSMAATALGLDYSLGGRVSLQLEKTFLAGGAVLGAGTMKLIGKLGEVKYPTQQDVKIQEALAQNYKNAINYYDEVGKEIETTLPTTIKVEDINSGNVFEAAKQMLGNNAPSILVALGTSGTGALLTKGMSATAALATRKKMANLGMGIFFEMEAGGKLGDIEVGEKYAQENIDALNAMLERDKKEGIVKTPDEILSIKQQISDNENALSFTGMQKAFSTVMYGGIASYAERLGTLSYMNGLTKTSKVYGASLFKKTIRGVKGAIYNTGVELLEETATTLGHNLTDITVLNENKSMIEGLDADFLVNTVFTSLAIQGPSMGMNSYNALKGEVSTRQEREASRVRTQEVLQIQNELNNTSPLNFEKRRELTKRKLELLQEAEITDVQVVQKISRMTPKEVTDLFEANRLKREALKNLQELGGDIDSQSEFNKKQKERLIEEYNKHEGKRELLLGKLDDRNKKALEAALKIAGLEKGVDYNLEDEAEMAFQLGKYQLNQDVLKNIVGEEKVKIFKGESSKQQLEEYLKEKVKQGVISQKDADKALLGNKNAMFIGDEYVLMEDVALQGITVGGASALFAASSPLHELLHRDLIEAGIVVDGKIVKSAEDVVASIEDHLNSLSENNLIDKKNAKIIKNRIEQYKSKKGVDLEELITLVGDLKDQGIVSRETMSLNYDLKRFIKLTAGKLLGDKNAFLGFNTIEDIFRYIDSFQNRAKDQTLVIPPDEKEETVEVKESKEVTPLEAINNLIPSNIKTKKDYEAFVQDRRLFPPVFMATMENGVISNYVKSKSIGDEYSEAIKSVQNRLTNFNPEATRADGSIVGPEGFGEFIFANTRFGKLDAKKALAIKAVEKAETTSIDTKEAKQVEDVQTKTTDKGPDTRRKKTNVLKIGKVERKADTIKKIVKVKPGDTFKEVSDNNTGKVAEEIFDVPANKITDPKKNLTYAKKIKDGIPEPSEAGNIQSFYGDKQTAEKVIKILPQENVTSSDADINEIGENIDVDREVLGRGLGLNNRMLNYFYNKTDKRSKGKTSQPFIWELKPEFQNPTSEVIDQLQKDLGITPRGELNNYNRNIGQLLKGMAKFQAQQTSLSTAQRILTEQKAPKKQIASVTAAQSSKVAFSLNVLGQFNVEVKLDDLLQEKTGQKTYKLNTKDEVDTYIKALKKYVLPLMPRDFWFGQPGFISTSEVKKEIERFGDKFYEMYGLDIKKVKPQLDKAINNDKLLKKIIRENNIKTWGTEFTPGVRSKAKNYNVYQTYYKPEMQKLRNLPDSAFGKDVDGVEDFSRQAYGTIFKNAETIEGKIKNGEVKKFNDKVGAIHKALWDRINSAIKKDKKSAAAIGNYLKLTASQSNHWHKLGAAFVGYSPKPAGKMKGKNLVAYEYEHAMPATAAYIFLLDAALNEDVNFDVTYQLVMDNYKLIALDSAENAKLGAANLGTTMPKGWNLLFNKWYDRYFNIEVAKIDGGIDPKSILGLDGKTFEKTFNIKPIKFSKNIKGTETLVKAVVQGRKTIKESKGITVLDFDDTLATSKSLVISTSPDGVVRKLTAEEFAQEGADLLDQGWTHDFSEFSKVVDGKVASLFKKAMKLQGKFGPENMFVLTARPADSAPAIFEFLQANGLNIPLKNITGLANSTSEAKALWIADKVGEGYNDFYFADDALQNVQAVKNMLDQFDVKSKVQQARVKFSKGMSEQFNDILENVTGIESDKRFSIIKGRKRGESKGKFRYFVPPSHEDFVGLLYNFMGKGREGDKHRDFLEQALVRPLNRANRELDTARQSVANDYKALNKQFEDVKSKLTKKTPDGDFTFQDAIRVYLWDKHGHKIPGLSETDQTKLAELVMSDPQLQAYAETLNVISKQENYVAPTDGWNSGDIRMDLDDATGRIGREQYFSEFIENADIVFSEENLNKIEAGYGESVRESLEDMLYRIKTGRNRPSGSNKQVNKLMNFLNGSVGTVMFFNMRSALLQQMSIVNYINFADNNIFAAAKAFANQKQYWTDWSFIFNSDMLKQRRGGIQTDVNGAELAASLRNSKNPTRKLISKLLELGFLPTQIGDNIAIATGGASYYRNRINTYLKQGMSQKEAEAKAFTDFQDITQSTQQSARPDMVSKQQASVIGKVILNFQNVTSQFNRLGKKAFQDIYNRRITKPNTTQMQSDISNASRITYYFAVQNLIFYTLQTAMFAMLFDDDEEDVNNLFLKKRERLINGSIDSVLRGTGLIGGVVATLKNVAIAFARQRDVNYNPDESAVIVEALNLSPVIGIKARQVVNAEKTLNYNKKVIDEMETFDIDNPQWSAVTNYVQTFTNIPLNRLYNKTQNVRQSLNNDHAAWERTLMFLGWSQYNLDLENKKMEKIKQDIKDKKKTSGPKERTARERKVKVR